MAPGLVQRWLPEGGKLPEDAWQSRHRGILVVLWAHAPALALFGAWVGWNAGHLLLEVLPIVLLASIATWMRHRRAFSTVAASVGLMTSSAILVHLSGGVVEAHFHFFVMVGVVVLYQAWWPFIVAIAYVVLHHGVVGTLAPHEVFNHPAAINSPWKWATIHGAFILGLSAAGIVTWRLTTSLQNRALEREQQLAEAQQLAHVGSWEWDMERDVIEWSDEMYRIFGLDPAGGQPTLEAFFEMVHADDRSAMATLVEEAKHSPSPFAADFRIVTRSDEVRWVHGRGQALADDSGAVSRMRGTALDITERKRNEAALAREGKVRSLLQKVAAAANEASTVEEAMEVAIRQVCAFTGWPLGHAFAPDGHSRTMASTSIWHCDDAERFDVFRRATQATAMPNGVGLPGRVAASGLPAWITDVTADGNFPRAEAARQAGIVSAFGFPIPVGQEVAGVLEFFSSKPEPRDEELLEVMAQVGRQLGLVVERTRAIEQLRASEERSRTIVETASDPFVAMDDRGLVLDWNRGAEAMFGWSRSEVLERELASTIIPEESRQAHRDGLARYLATGEGPVVSNRVEVEAVHRDGTRFPVELAVWEVASPTGRSFNAFLRDISQHKQAEEALAAARDQAMETSRLQSEFLANMSHEIRTPMNGVIGLAGLLFDTGLDVTQRKYTEGIRSAGEALLTIINDVLDFSKADAGKVELEEVEFNLRDLLEETAALLAGAACDKGVELVGYCYPSVPTAVRGDPHRIRQVLLNLVGNAVKFTGHGEVVVRGRLVEEADASVVVRFEVADTGIGIDPSVHDRLFQPFTQADTSTTRRYGGTGLGLALSKRLVELMEGEIGVDSEPGRGSTFWFTARLSLPASTSPQAEPASSLEGVRVLIVDDNATNRLILDQQLSGWGMRPLAVESPHQALDLLRQAAATGDPYQLAVVDMQMPELDGLQVAQAINDDATLAGLPVILLSSSGKLAPAQDPQRLVRLSLIKPIRQSELYDGLLLALAPPAAVEPGQEAAGTEPQVVPAATANAAGNGHVEAVPEDTDRRQVLVVEDNAVNQMVAIGQLTTLGYRTDLATNGREAVEAVSRQDYAAVLMDCQMPEMDGYTATREIRRMHADGRRVPIIAMTASAMVGDRERCIDAGMDDYIAKPVRRAEIEAVLERWIDHDRPDAEPDPLRPPGRDVVLDTFRIRELRALGQATASPEMFDELVREFVQQSTVRLAELRSGVGRGDGPSVAAAAHSLRGAAAAMGARVLAGAAGALEGSAATGALGDAAGQLSVVEVELERALAALRAERTTPAGATLPA